MRRGRNRFKISKLSLLVLLLVISLLSISVGFSALSTTLSINGTAAFTPVDMIRVVELNQDTLINSIENSRSYTYDTVTNLIDINSNEGTAIYTVKITNFGQVTKELSSIEELVFSNSEMEYKLDGINIGSVIRPKQSITFKIIFKYKDGITPSENRLNSKLKFIFSDYEYSNVIAYFMPYDGGNNLFGFVKTNITSFSRNTTLTLDEVLNKSGVKLISNSSSDQYNSEYDIYGWVENNNFYWWSEASFVYFHPETRNAFEKFGNIVTIDLDGTSTEMVENFSHWFDTCRKLRTIKGKIDTSGLKLEYNDSFNYANDTNNDSSSRTSLAYMFNDCNNLESIDLSAFNTSNATDMKRMFGGCKKLKNIDVTNFDTTNVKSMYWMFRSNESLTNIDLSNFNTSNVENMFGMFVSSINIKTITLGENFDTSKVKNMGNMFYNVRKLTTIYAKHDFALMNGVNSTNMFYNDTNLVGAAGTEYEKTFDSKYANKTYAKIANMEQSGYFTLASENIYYTVLFNSNGGVGTMSSQKLMFGHNAVLNKNTYTREDYTFIGWNTKPDGTGTTYKDETSVIDITSNGLITLYAMWHKNTANAVVVFEHPEPIIFDSTNKYLDTGIYLYNEENYYKDYEIYFEIDEYLPTNQVGNGQQTLMNTKLEDSSKGYPGLVFRRDDATNNLELTQTINGKKIKKTFPYSDVNNVRIIRKDNKIYYSINGSSFTLLQDMSDFDSYFDKTVWFGSSQDSNGNSFRCFNGTLSNMYIRLGKLEDNILNN